MMLWLGRRKDYKEVPEIVKKHGGVLDTHMEFVSSPLHLLSHNMSFSFCSMSIGR